MTAFQIDGNLAFDNYDELIETINDWLDREDLTGVAPQMIALAEDEIKMAVEPYFLETLTSLVSDVGGFAALPTNTKRVKRVMYEGCSVPQRGINSVDRMTEDKTRPWAYTMEQGGIRVWPAAEHTISVLYQPRLERLTNGNPTNNLLDEFPSLYFYGSLVFAHGYVADDERAARFRRLFDMQLVKVRDYYLKQRHSGPMVARAPFVP